MAADIDQQHFFMEQAIAWGEKGRLTAPPNPWVGCVIVKNGVVIGKGFHARAGEPHAEINALADAKEDPQGATVFVTLEPCSHHGKTPPCIEALIKAKVGHVVCALIDPDPQVQGKGIASLQAAGIKVTVGVAEKQASAALAPYLFHRRHGKPLTTLKIAASLDGKIALGSGISKWITSNEARGDVHALRAQFQAVMVGSRTAVSDCPRLTTRGIATPEPLRVIIDGSGRTPPIGPLFDTKEAATLIFTSDHCDPMRLVQWKECGTEVIVIKSLTGNLLNLDEVLTHLGKKGILSLLVEGGGHLHTQFLQKKLAQRLTLYLGSCLLGNDGRAFYDHTGPLSMERRPSMDLNSATLLGGDVRLDYTIRDSASVI